MRNILIVICLLLLEINVQAQVGGLRSFESLSVPVSAAQAGTGGVNVSSTLEDPTFTFSNPALLRESFRNKLSITYTSYIAGIDYTAIAYPFQLKNVGLVSVGLQYFNFGDFEGFDDTGARTQNFSASDYALSVSHSRKAGNFRYGASLKFVNSSISGFNSNAFLFDFGGVFIHPEKEFNVALVVKNAGFLLSEFTSTSNTRLPFDVQLGTTFKPQYAPFRFTLTTYNLWRGDITFFDPEVMEDNPGTIDRIFRRVAFGTEVLIAKSFNLRLGYNHLVRRELRLEEVSGGAGFSFGFLLKIKAFELAYTRSLYHVSGGNNYFTVTTDFGRILKKKKTKTGNLIEDGE